MPGPAVATRRQPLLMEEAATDVKNGGRLSRIGETAGECAALCCCCPCGMMHILILAVYRLPAGIWRRKRKSWLMRKKRRILSEEKQNDLRRNFSFGLYMTDEEEEEEDAVADDSGKIDAGEWEDEIWERFYGAGFWRSHTKRYD